MKKREIQQWLHFDGDRKQIDVNNKSEITVGNFLFLPMEKTY